MFSLWYNGCQINGHVHWLLWNIREVASLKSLFYSVCHFVAKSTRSLLVDPFTIRFCEAQDYVVSLHKDYKVKANLWGFTKYFYFLSCLVTEKWEVSVYRHGRDEIWGHFSVHSLSPARFELHVNDTLIWQRIGCKGGFVFVNSTILEFGNSSLRS